ncbi:hypothetical protein BBJ28_00022985, partial [Nothophytophthora sp. Chile5]
MATAEGSGGTDAVAFVNALYRRVLQSVKASNAIPSEDDGFHFHSKFSPAFAAHAQSSGAKAEALVRLLTKRRRSDQDNGDGESDGDDSEDDADGREDLFDGPEPNARITDYADMLLDEATKHLARFAQGETGSSATTTTLRPLENKPQSFDKNKKAKKSEQDEAAAAAAEKKRTRGGAQDKPQELFDEQIDNSDAPFVSKLREKVHALNDGGAGAAAEEEEDEIALRHPYHPEIRALKYASWQLEAATEPYDKVALQDATYLWVDSETTLMQMMRSLTAVEARVIAVDLEHHSYRSYMGLTCLMQISTAREDFLVDTLALRGKLQALNQVFCDPEKVKVLHGSDMDILWLQRDLGLYVVNLFDTGQAARLLQYPRFSLAYLLKHHCGVDADKQYQLADWRTRPLDKNMVKYAREDTRYLLFIYDRLKLELLQAGAKTRASLLFQALQNSSKLCLQVYEKPRPTEEDALAVGEKLKGTVNIQRLSELQQRVLTALYLWRDRVARQEDESIGYVLPNHVLMKLTKHLPVRSDLLFRTCHPVPALVRKHAHQITTMIAAEKAKLAEEEAKAAAVTQEQSASIAAQPKKKTWTEDGEEETTDDVEMTTVSSSKRVGRAEYARWESGKRKAGVAAAVGPDSGSSSSSSKPLTLGITTTSTAEAAATASTLLDKVNAMVESATFTIAEHEPSEAPAQPTSLSAVAASNTPNDAEDSKPKLPQSISEAYHLSNRSKQRKTTTVDTSSASQVKDRAQAFMQTAGEEDGEGGEGKEEDSGFQSFDYAAASDQIAGAKFQLEKTSDARGGGRGRGGRGRGGGRNQSQAGGSYNPFAAMSGGRGGRGGRG